MKYYVSKLIPPRPTFMQDITPAETKLMQQHSTYWRDLMERGLAVAFGPVADPAGAFGLGILEVPADVDPRRLLADDPVVKAGVGFRFEIHPMPEAVVRRLA